MSITIILLLHDRKEPCVLIYAGLELAAPIRVYKVLVNFGYEPDTGTLIGVLSPSSETRDDRAFLWKI